MVITVESHFVENSYASIPIYIYSSVFRFPKDPIRRAIWLTNCEFVEKEIEHNRMLCSSHFEKDCIVIHRSRRVLKKSAVPVIFEKIKKNKRNGKRSEHSQSLQKPGKL